MTTDGQGCLEYCELNCLYAVVVPWRLTFCPAVHNGDTTFIANYITRYFSSGNTFCLNPISVPQESCKWTEDEATVNT